MRLNFVLLFNKKNVSRSPLRFQLILAMIPGVSGKSELIYTVFFEASLIPQRSTINEQQGLFWYSQLHCLALNLKAIV